VTPIEEHFIVPQSVACIMASVPRWKPIIEDAITKHKHSVVIQIATISVSQFGTSSPHVRSHIFRSFISPSSLPSRPFLLTTTDVRTPKIAQIDRNPNVEVAWWIPGTQEQFRIAGWATSIPSPTHPSYDELGIGLGHAIGFSGFREENFDWEAKRKEVFNDMNGAMKASWCRPIPGSPLKSPDDAKSWPTELPKLGEAKTDEERKNLEKALKNFALIVIEPSEVDYIELGVNPNRRTRFIWKGKEAEWSEEMVVP